MYIYIYIYIYEKDKLNFVGFQMWLILAFNKLLRMDWRLIELVLKFRDCVLLMSAANCSMQHILQAINGWNKHKFWSKHASPQQKLGHWISWKLVLYLTFIYKVKLLSCYYFWWIYYKLFFVVHQWGMHTYVGKYWCTCAHAPKHSYKHAPKYSCIHVCTHALMNMHTHTHTHTHIKPYKLTHS